MAKARAKANGESKSGTFKRLFAANRELLKVPSIADVMKLYEAEVGRSATAADRGVAANIKSKMRKEYGLRRGRRKGGRKAASAVNGAVALAVPRATASMLALEDSIEDCIYRARRMEMESLADVVRLLRRARNHLIVMNGAK
jgi:hypothetical protein